MEFSAWLLLSYVLGTAAGWWLAQSHTGAATVELVIDSLIDQGYLKTRRAPDGSVEVLKHDHTDEG